MALFRTVCASLDYSVLWIVSRKYDDQFFAKNEEPTLLTGKLVENLDTVVLGIIFFGYATDKRVL